MSNRSVCVILCACAHATAFRVCDSVNLCVCVCARVADRVSVGVGGEYLCVCLCGLVGASAEADTIMKMNTSCD